jgi:hypothetical protein
LAGRLWCIFLFQKPDRSCKKYVLSQEEHHKKKSFRTEYLQLLEKFEIEFRPEYLFEFYD